MACFIEVNGRVVEVPQDVEAAGPDAVAAFLSKQNKGKPAAPAQEES